MAPNTESGSTPNIDPPIYVEFDVQERLKHYEEWPLMSSQLEAITFERLQGEGGSPDVRALLNGIRDVHRAPDESGLHTAREHADYKTDLKHREIIEETLDTVRRFPPAFDDMERRAPDWAHDKVYEILSETKAVLEDRFGPCGDSIARELLLQCLDEVHEALKSSDNPACANQWAESTTDLWALCRFVWDMAPSASTSSPTQPGTPGEILLPDIRNPGFQMLRSDKSRWHKLATHCEDNAAVKAEIEEQSKVRKEHMTQKSVVEKAEARILGLTSDLGTDVDTQLDEINQAKSDKAEADTQLERREGEHCQLASLLKAVVAEIRQCESSWTEEMSAYHQHNLKCLKEILARKDNQEAILRERREKQRKDIAEREALIELQAQQLRARQAEADVTDYKLTELANGQVADQHTHAQTLADAIPSETALRERIEDLKAKEMATKSMILHHHQLTERIQVLLRERQEELESAEKELVVCQHEALEGNYRCLHGLENARKTKRDRLSTRFDMEQEAFMVAQEDEDPDEVERISNELNKVQGQLTDAEEARATISAIQEECSTRIEASMVQGMRAVGVYETILLEGGEKYVVFCPTGPDQHVVSFWVNDVQIQHPKMQLDLKALEAQQQRRLKAKAELKKKEAELDVGAEEIDQGIAWRSQVALTSSPAGTPAATPRPAE